MPKCEKNQKGGDPLSNEVNLLRKEHDVSGLHMLLLFSRQFANTYIPEKHISDVSAHIRCKIYLLPHEAQGYQRLYILDTEITRKDAHLSRGVYPPAQQL